MDVGDAHVVCVEGERCVVVGGSGDVVGGLCGFCCRPGLVELSSDGRVG